MFVWRYLKPHWPGAVVATFSSFVQGVAAAAISSMAGPALQMLMTPDRNALMRFREILGPQLGGVAERWSGLDGLTVADLFARLPLWLLIAATVKAFFSLTQWYLWERASEKISARLRAEIVDGYTRLDPARRRLDEARAREGELSSIISTDVRRMREYIVHFYGGLPREGLQVLFLGATLVLLNSRLFLVFALGVVPCLAFITVLGKKLRRRARAALRNYGQLSEWLQQRLIGIETIKHYQTETIEETRFREQTTDLYKRFFRASRVKARTSPMIEAFGIAAMAAALLFAFRDIADGRTTAAVTISFFGTLAMASQAGAKLGRYLNSNREGTAAMDRIRATLAFLTENAAPSIGIVPTGSNDGRVRLTCDAVSVRYPGQDRDALADFSRVFEGGRVYCLFGPSGSGKSTLFNLILGLVPPTRGRVGLAIPRADAPLPVCFMPQRLTLTPDSLAANVAYPDIVPDHARAEAALRLAGLSSLLAELPDGLETLVGEGGKGLSGGQAQRVMLARLHYHADSPVVLMDEGTSALDPEMERLALDSLRARANAGALVIMIAHRPAGARMADELIVLRDGSLVAAGPSIDVMKSSEFTGIVT